MAGRRRPFARTLTASVVLLGLLAAPFVPSAPTTPAAAAPVGSDFDAGYIISDGVFFDSDAMTEAEVQAFLNARVPNCAGANGQPCLKDYRTSTFSRAAVEPGHCTAYAGEGSESAARIIVKVGLACGISPRVLLVMLQKEQALVTATSPTERQYRVAMGYGCPDTADCDARYFGFYNQVYNAAWQLRQYSNYPQRAYRIGSVPIQYHPNTACGSSTVNIRNQATANLYNYTPYQPNAAALANLRGVGDSCSAYGNRNFWVFFHDWFGDPTGANALPIGNVELVQAQPGSYRVAGWALDPDTSTPIAVHVYVGTFGTAHAADLVRDDVAAIHGLGNRHGFDVTVPARGADQSRVCVYAINAGPGAPALLRCVDTVPMSGPPVGSTPAVTATASTIEVSGWALDPDTTAAIPVHVYVGASGTAHTASAATTLPATYSAYGPNHGYTASIPAAEGVHRVCTYGINTGPGGHSLLGCTDVVVGAPQIADQNRAPIGSVERIRGGVGTVEVSGWALDPDTRESIQVHAYVDSAGTAFTADGDRPDVARAYPVYGAAHGFARTLTATPGQHRVCVYAINTGAGGHTELGCSTVTVQDFADQGRAPIGNVEAIRGGVGTVDVSGWALDPDTSRSIQVHAYVDSAGTAFTADGDRPDVARLYPAHGPAHGFAETLTASPGERRVCLYAINTGAGGHTQLACATVTVGSTADLGRVPIGNVEEITAVSGGVDVSGWALDPDTSRSIQVHVYVDSAGVATTANLPRPDVGAAYPSLGPDHGFDTTVSASPGPHRVCVYAINTGPGGHVQLRCADVVVP